MTEPMLRARGLARTFGGLRAVDDLDLDLAHAEIHALIGPNGAGKSTLIGLLCGTITPDRGRVVLDGRDITRLSPAERAARGLARSFQVPRLAAPLSVRRNVMLPVAAARGSCFRFWRACRSDRVLQDETMRILARVGLERRADIAVGTLS
ncbi:MAG: ATP-binding cassette domain-containing protein, partial [Alphaproteobacteria bacterium]|nr:ATP-binding cassette domain-containing protein [Alphaproteobacteria bacterium]